MGLPRWIRTPQQLAATLQSGKLTGAASDYQVNEEGFYVRSSQYHTVNEVPLKAYDAEGNSLTAIGDVNPDFNMGIANTVQCLQPARRGASAPSAAAD